MCMCQSNTATTLHTFDVIFTFCLVFFFLGPLGLLTRVLGEEVTFHGSVAAAACFWTVVREPTAPFQIRDF